MKQKTKVDILTLRQSAYLRAYSNPSSPSFGNSYKSALAAGYSSQTAKNLTHLKPDWLSENIGNISKQVISPEEITAILSNMIYSPDESAVIRLKAIELMMKFYKMLNSNDQSNAPLQISIDLSGQN